MKMKLSAITCIAFPARAYLLWFCPGPQGHRLALYGLE
jgi:hypothetical protein